MYALHRTLVAGVMSLLIGTGSVASAQEPTREITNIRGDLYRVQNNQHYSVFLVTEDGVIATDPVDAEAAEWLKAELKRRFNQDVKYLIYSHDHADHISGGEVFADTATIIAHANAKADMVGEQRNAALPNITFQDSLTLELGGKTVELSYIGRNHSDNNIVMDFVDERTLYVVDFIFIKMIAYANLPDSYIDEWLESLRIVEGMDFDIVAPGHGPLGDKSDVTAFREYMEDLHGQVLTAVRAGKTVEETQAEVDLTEYADRAGYEAWVSLNIGGMYRQLSHHMHPSNLLGRDN